MLAPMSKRFLLGFFFVVVNFFFCGSFGVVLFFFVEFWGVTALGLFFFFWVFGPSPVLQSVSRFLDAF